MSWRLAAGIEVWYSRGYVSGISEIPALLNFRIPAPTPERPERKLQFSQQQLLAMSVEDRLSLGVQEVVYHPYDDKAYTSSGPVEEVINDVIHVTHPNLTEKYTIAQVQNHIRKDAKEVYARLADEGKRAETVLLEQEGATDPDYLNWVQYNADLETSRTTLKGQFIAMKNATSPATTYQEWVDFGRTWKQNLPLKPELVDENEGEVNL